ncbi:vacuolar protein sorting-associated protein 54 isoform X1 [Neodiprion lecontei]|uniref:Vacuolar protein sorting-associated protein 54 n=1 Tax=Neodiprion lecontei TaxID=441921 RepID=A0ABM3FGB9_NEOLC|nr:vacuolar protein sorting-associated protein 54 isoform X1 [Neodiprion lecontei]
MAKIIKAPEVSTASFSCEYCPNITFRYIEDFIRHLREQHCAREGGSFVCRYGYNSVCSSLPVEGVSDKDYIAHATKHATMQQQQQQQKKSNGQVTGSSPSWTIYSAAQNLPAVLNDPNKGKQSNFLTKTWGDAFVEKVDIPKSPYLPDVSMQHFDNYMKKIARRYRKHSRMNTNSNNSTSPNELLQNFPNLRKVKSLERSQFDLSSIPKIFLMPHLDLAQKENFLAVFPFAKEGLLDEDGNTASHAKLMQEKVWTRLHSLSHYLDIVEVRIAEQVASKSQAFFHAMTSHDALMEQLTQTITVLKALRENIHQIDKSLVKDSLEILRLERARCNHLMVQEKLKLMSTVHQTQPMIQLLLSTPDYVAALDLISTTQEILLQELNGVHSFRHFSSQLTEMERLIDKMLSTEFERYATADLNRPLGGENVILDGDKLVSIISGLLRQKHFQFVDTYKEEAIMTVRAVTKQCVIEALAASDSCSDHLEVGSLSLVERLSLLHSTIQSFTFLLHRVKAVHDVIRDTSDLAAGQTNNSVDSSLTDCLLSRDEHVRVTSKLSDMLTSVCEYCHERLGHLLSTAANERDKSQNEKDKPMNDTAVSKQIDKEIQNWNEKVHWLSDKATALQVCQLASMVEGFTVTCEKLCGKQCTALRSAFKAQATKFVQRFHAERKTKLSLLLDSERWRQADVPTEFQNLVSHVYENKSFPTESKLREDTEKSKKKDAAEPVSNFIFVGDEKYAVVGTTLMLIQMIHEYCSTSNELTTLSGTLGRHLAELLRHFNSRCCQLVLGAGAMQVAGLKTITSTILVLASRSLQLLLWFMPFVKAHFQVLADHGTSRGVAGAAAVSGGVALLDSVERDIRAHVREIEGKVLTIVGSLVGAQLSHWTARPPVPSQPFKNISRHVVKLHEAVSSILPSSQVESLYRSVNTTLKEKLREQLVKMNIVNNGGPQHGVVTSELTFYLEALKALKVLPMEELNDDWMNAIWTR